MKRILGIIAIILCIGAAIAANDSRGERKDRFSRKLGTFNTIVKELQTNYVDTLDANTIMDKTIGALLYQIDPYTEYYPAGDQDEILSISEGKYAGIGSFISRRGDITIFSEPQWGSPARKGGIRAGDIILAINGDSITSKTPVGDVSKRLRGQAGTEVKIDVRRPHVADSLLSFNIIRSDIKPIRCLTTEWPTTAWGT